MDSSSTNLHPSHLVLGLGAALLVGGAPHAGTIGGGGRVGVSIVLGISLLFGGSHSTCFYISGLPYWLNLHGV